MSATFSNLHEVVQVIAEHIQEEVGIAEVQAGTPRDVSSTTEAAARITLLFTTPQPGHRNDPAERQGDGTRRFPPLALSCFYLVTTSGADSEDPIAAHHALGQIMTLYHDSPVLQLPLSANPGAPPGAFTPLGEGVLTVVQVPTALDQLDKIWTSLNAQLQPWALFEVSPVQLVSQLDDAGPAPVVHPAGLALDVRAGMRPQVVRIAPDAVRQSGRVRIDAALVGSLEGVWVDGVDVPVGDASLVPAPGGSPLLLRLDDGGLAALGPGAHPMTVRAAGLVSRRGALRVAAATAPAVDAPAGLAHDPATDLVLTGANLTGAQEAVLWPDGGVSAPTDVHTLAVSAVTAGSVTVAAAGGLATVPPGRGAWRLAIRVGAQVFTPYVLVEFAS
ncbi:MAG TPA: Pvc16 family protein [Nakamurella sp.]